MEVLDAFESPNHEPPGTFIKIRLSSAINLKNPSWKSKPITIDIEPVFRGGRIPSMPDRVSLRALLVISNFPTLIPLTAKSQKQGKQDLLPLPDRRFLISDEGDVSLESEARHLEVEINDKLSLCKIYAVGGCDRIEINGRESTMTSIGGEGVGIYVCDQIPPAEQWKFSFEGCSLEVLGKQSEAPLSPILAAAERALPWHARG